MSCRSTSRATTGEPKLPREENVERGKGPLPTEFTDGQYRVAALRYVFQTAFFFFKPSTERPVPLTKGAKDTKDGLESACGQGSTHVPAWPRDGVTQNRELEYYAAVVTAMLSGRCSAPGML